MMKKNLKITRTLQLITTATLGLFLTLSLPSNNLIANEGNCPNIPAVSSNTRVVRDARSERNGAATKSALIPNSPTLPSGRYSPKKGDSALYTTLISSTARSTNSLPLLQVSGSGHYLITQDDGRPFFWLADTGWLLFHRLEPAEIERYLEDRAAKGFTVIQTMIVGTDDEFKMSDSDGGLAFEEGDPRRPVETFFKKVDATVAKANSLGLRMAIAPTWANKVRKSGPYKGTRVFDEKRARDYGKYLGRRYRDAAVVWIIGGDCLVEKGDEAIWRALAEGLRAGGDGRHLITGHFRSLFRNGSAWHFHNEPWLDFNLAYSGHIWDAPTYEGIFLARSRRPIKPVIDGEPTYDNHPLLPPGKEYYKRKKSWDGKRRGDAHQVRQSAYWAMLAGAAGHTYGAHDIWQMYDPKKRKPINHANTAWHEAIDFPAATQMGIMRRLFESFAWEKLLPDQSVIADGQRPEEHHAQAARASDNSFAFVYLPKGDPLSIRLNVISGKNGATVLTRWFNPRDGKWAPVGVFSNLVTRKFSPPSRGEKNDWVLVLTVNEDAK